MASFGCFDLCKVADQSLVWPRPRRKTCLECDILEEAYTIRASLPECKSRLCRLVCSSAFVDWLDQIPLVITKFRLFGISSTLLYSILTELARDSNPIANLSAQDQINLESVWVTLNYLGFNLLPL